MKCAQQGKRLKVKVKDLTTEEFSPVRKCDLKAGASLMADFKGKTYPVIFQAFAGENLLCIAFRSSVQITISLRTVPLGLLYHLAHMSNFQVKNTVESERRQRRKFQTSIWM